MKIILLISLLLGLVSCNLTYYYAYEDKEGYYYTFEVRKKEVIYRAMSSKYNYTIPNNPYIYIYMSSFVSDKKSGVTRFYFRPISLRTLYPLAREEYGINIVDNIGTAYASSKSTQLVTYVRDKDKIHMNRGSKDVNFTFGNGEVKVTWLPYELKRVKKIDYDKFTRAGMVGSFNYENP